MAGALLHDYRQTPVSSAYILLMLETDSRLTIIPSVSFVRFFFCCHSPFYVLTTSFGSKPLLWSHITSCISHSHWLSCNLCDVIWKCNRIIINVNAIKRKMNFVSLIKLQICAWQMCNQLNLSEWMKRRI